MLQTVWSGICIKNFTRVPANTFSLVRGNHGVRGKQIVYIIMQKPTKI